MIMDITFVEGLSVTKNRFMPISSRDKLLRSSPPLSHSLACAQAPNGSTTT